MVAEDVYHWMKKEKGKKSFSELIRSLKHRKSHFKEVSGLNVSEGREKVKKAIRKASKESMEKLKNKFGRPYS